MSEGNGSVLIRMYLMHRNGGGAHIVVTSVTPELKKSDRRITDNFKNKILHSAIWGEEEIE